MSSWSYLSRTAIPTLYASNRDKVKQELSKVPHFFATTELWSSIGMRPYTGYTNHFIDNEWKLQDDHTGENLVETMEATLEAWEPNAANQVCLTTDNRQNFISAAELLGWTRLSCFCHDLHLAITHAPKNDHRYS